MHKLISDRTLTVIAKSFANKTKMTNGIYLLSPHVMRQNWIGVYAIHAIRTVTKAAVIDQMHDSSWKYP